MENSLVESYTALLNSISSIAKAHGRNPEELSLVAVTKNHSWNEIEPLYCAGQRQFGENRLQPFLEKIALAPKACEWHFIGPLQKNKVRKVIEHFSLIHSVDTFELAKKISECSSDASGVTRILLQVNTSGESSKQGMSYEDCLEYSEKILNLPSLSVEGLMTMAPFTEDMARIRFCFHRLKQLRAEL
jgi:PLP dependent protein